MSTRLSFGSRAGGYTDYHGGNAGMAFTTRGPYLSLEALTEALRNEIHQAEQSSVPECTTCELSLHLNANLPLVRPTIGPYAENQAHDLPDEFKTVFNTNDGSDSTNKHPTATCASIVNVVDARGGQIVQRAASRGIIHAVEAADGFRYSFNNAWTAKEGEGSRFSFICQDSMQNKDRHANGFTRTTKHLKDGAERGPRKPTYDCKGSVSVKFSCQRQSVDVYYRHYAIHETVAARKPPPRPPPQPVPAPNDNITPRESGGLAATLQAENYVSAALAMVKDQSPMIDTSSPLAAKSDNAQASKSLKRKRDSLPAPRATDPSKPLSLVELLAGSETANKPQPAHPPPQQKQSKFPPPVAYDLPSWQEPPPPLTAPRDGQRAPPYPPPYQPTNGRVAIPPTPPTAPVQQFRPNVPAEHVTQPQAMFMTMKPAGGSQHIGPHPVIWRQLQTPAYNTIGRQRQRGSKACTNCRSRKTKCDETQPCGACVKSLKSDCVYESPSAQTDAATATWGRLTQPGPPPQMQQQDWQQQSHSPSNGAVRSNTFHSSANAAPERPDSPDPWFPKR